MERGSGSEAGTGRSGGNWSCPLPDDMRAPENGLLWSAMTALLLDAVERDAAGCFAINPKLLRESLQFLPRTFRSAGGTQKTICQPGDSLGL